MARPSYPKLRRTVDIELLSGKRRRGQITNLAPLTAILSGTNVSKTISLNGVSRAAEV